MSRFANLLQSVTRLGDWVAVHRTDKEHTMKTEHVPKTFRMELGALRLHGERINNRLHVRLATDRKVPQGMTRGPTVSFDLDPRDALALASNLKLHANALLEVTS